MIRVGFVINFKDQGWLGGINYYRNLLNAIMSYPDRKIEPVIFTGYASDKNILSGFPDIEIINDHMFDLYHPRQILRVLFKMILHRDLILENCLLQNDISLLSHSFCLGKNSKIITIGWIADFQHKSLPNFFSKKEIRARDNLFSNLCQNCNLIIFSSNTAKIEAEKFFPNCHQKFSILPFATWNLDLNNLPEFIEIKEKYNINFSYFLVPNQFWVHKNHIVVIEALKLLKEKGISITVISTGNTHDYRNPEYFQQIQNKIQEYDLSNNFITLGIIPYSHLIQLMKNSIAIINPSYFEGWSTTVEEAKILKLTIILSDIAVHREQNPELGLFFPPNNPQLLANLLINTLHSYQSNKGLKQVAINESDIESSKRNFAKRYEDIVFLALSQPNK